VNLRLSVNLVLACMTLAAPVQAQGMPEYADIMGAQGKPSGSVVNSLTQTYGSAGKSINNSLQMTRPQVDFDTAASYGKQANSHFLSAQQFVKQGKRNDAIREYGNALTIRQRVWGDSDPAVAELLKQQAELYRQEGQFHECEGDYRKLLAIDIKRYGPGSKQLDGAICNLAELCERQCSNEDALNYYQQLVAIRQRNNPPGCAQIKNARLKLALALTVTCDYPAAEQIFKVAISEEEAKPAPDKAYLCKVLDGYGGMLRETYRNDEAEKVEAQQRELQASMQGKSTPAPAASTSVAPSVANEPAASNAAAAPSPVVVTANHK
jgi:tetratricopeptide (TPR) repeat protein